MAVEVIEEESEEKEKKKNEKGGLFKGLNFLK